MRVVFRNLYIVDLKRLKALFYPEVGETIYYLDISQINLESMIIVKRHKFTLRIPNPLHNGRRKLYKRSNAAV